MSTAIDLEKSVNTNGNMTQQVVSFGSAFPILIIFTSLGRTLMALEKASRLARSRSGGIEILALQTVPFPVPLDAHSVPFQFLVRRLEELASRFPGQIKISAYLCRDQLEALKRILNRNCTVLMGVRKRWWPTHDASMARKLHRAGYNVILVETE